MNCKSCEVEIDQDRFERDGLCVTCSEICSKGEES